jgi:DNA polymerase
MTQSKQERLDQIRADILRQDICPDLALAATNLVFGDGNPDADIVIIGEAPGRQEDEQGLPFVGASGNFLAEMLASINMRREQVYITNIVKYRPPNNRDPLPAEKTAFLPFLERQLDVIKPLLVVTLGRHSMNCFLPGLQISEVHGEPKRKGGRVFLPLYHPAAALYNGGLRQTLVEDFQNIPQTLQLIRKGN